MKEITLLEWLDTIDALSESISVFIKFPAQAKHRFTGFNEIRRRASPAFLTAPIQSVWIGKGDDGIVITLMPPKQYSTKRP